MTASEYLGENRRWCKSDFGAERIALWGNGGAAWRQPSGSGGGFFFSRGRAAQFFGDSDQFGQRAHAHLLHHSSPVELHGAKSDADLSRDLFVEQARDDVPEDLTLTGSQTPEALMKGPHTHPRSPAFRISRQPGLDRAKEGLALHGLGEEVHRPRPHRADTQGNVAVSGEEHNGQEFATLFESLLQFKAARARHPYV